ncbi:hypothetical protein [Streptomyces sp. NBC_00986]|uniref:hypothetical protein n=1 Tax=Streptomyces sp. NBC_00986 TaxID=2903702 RepID=UPI00386DC15D|nr:hypothetical protein OG504_07605 [Streptomyces sp. NBC_00986]
MDAELVTLVGTGTTTLVGLMVTDAWEQTKQRVVRIFSRDNEPSAVARELEETRAALIAAAGGPGQEDLTSDLTALVRLRLRSLLEQNPDAAAELRRLVDQFASTAPSGTVHNSITGGTQHGPVIQGHTFTNLTFNSSGDNPPSRTG